MSTEHATCNVQKQLLKGYCQNTPAYVNRTRNFIRDVQKQTQKDKKERMNEHTVSHLNENPRRRISAGKLSLE